MYWIFITPLSASSFGRIYIHTYVYGDRQKEKKILVRLQEIGYGCYI